MSKKNKKNKKQNKSGASSKAKADASSTVIANVRLVAALKGYDGALKQSQSYLVDVGTIVQEEHLTRAEVVASIVEARGCSPKTAGEQYSRMKRIINDPKQLELLRSGKADLKTVREKTVKKQENVSPEKKKLNAEKKFASSIFRIVSTAKDMGWTRKATTGALDAALKKAGVK